MSAPKELTFGRLIVNLQRLHADIPDHFPKTEDTERVADLQEVVQHTIYIARAARRGLQGFTEDTPLGLKRDLELAIQEIHRDHTLRQKSTTASTAQKTTLTTSTSPIPTQHSAAPTPAITKPTSKPKDKDTCALPTVTGNQENISHASNSKPSVQVPTHSSFTPENMTDADREAAAALICLSESDYNPNSSLNSSLSSSFTFPIPAESLGASTNVPDASFPSTIRNASSLKLMYSNRDPSTRSHDFFTGTISRKIGAFTSSRNVAASNTAHGIPVYTTKPSSSTPRKRSRGIDDDTYADAGTSHVDTYYHSPPARKRRSVSPTTTSATQAAPVSHLLDDQMSAHHAFVMGLEYALLNLGDRVDPTAVEELRFRAAAEHGTGGVVGGFEKSSSDTKGFWDVV